MASRRVVCPRCNSLVGVPSLQPTHPGTPALGPMTPEERRRARRNRPPDSPPDEVAETAATASAPPSSPPTEQLLFPEPLDSDPVQAVPNRRSQKSVRDRGRLQPETRWYECLAYPFRAAALIVGATLALTCYTAISALVFPQFLLWPISSTDRVAGGLGWATMLVAILALVAEFLNGAMTSAAAGVGPFVVWPSASPKPVVKTLCTWLVCFAAGPVLPAVAAGYYLFYCGDPTLVDWVIVTELLAVAVGYWLLALLAVVRFDSLLAANPLRVAELLDRLGPRVIVVTTAAAAFLLAGGCLMVASVAHLHESEITGLFGIGCAWVGLLFLSTFLFRLLGMWSYRSGLAEVADETPATGKVG